MTFAPANSPRRIAKNTPARIVLVSTVREFATAHRPELLTESILHDLGDRAVFLHDGRLENRLFDMLPETGAPTEDTEWVLDELEDYAVEHADELETVLGTPTSHGRLEWGLHLDATRAEVQAAFERDAFEVRTFTGAAPAV